MNVVVVGAGMYVLGRGTAGYGTILPALVQASKQFDIGNVTICSPSSGAKADVERVTDALNGRLGASLKVQHRSLDEALSTGSASAFDCAVVCVPDDLHFAIGRRVLEAGLHCLMVKPFVLTIDEGLQLISLAESRGLYGAVEFHKRFDETNLVVHRIVNDGTLGTIAYAAVEYSQRITVPRDAFAAWAARTNCFDYLGVHYVDLLQFISGSRPHRIAALGTRGVLSNMGVDTYDSVHALIEWQPRGDAAHSFVSQFAVGWIDPACSTAMSDQRYVIVGSASRVECDQKHRGLQIVESRGSAEDVNSYFSEYFPSASGALDFGGYGYRSIERFLLDVGAIRRNEVSPSALEGRRPTFRSSLVSTAVLQAARHSLAHDGEWCFVDGTV